MKITNESFANFWELRLRKINKLKREFKCSFHVEQFDRSIKAVPKPGTSNSLSIGQENRGAMYKRRGVTK